MELFDLIMWSNQKKNESELPISQILINKADNLFVFIVLQSLKMLFLKNQCPISMGVFTKLKLPIVP